MESNTDFEPFGKPMDSGVSLFVDPYLGEIECLPETKKLTVEDVLATLKDWNETLGEPVDSAVVNKTKEVFDPVHHVKHYQMFPEHEIEVKDVVRTAIKKNISDPVEAAWYKDVLKYLLRCGEKGQYLQDLKKAKTYLEWMIQEVEDNAKV